MWIYSYVAHPWNIGFEKKDENWRPCFCLWNEHRFFLLYISCPRNRYGINGIGYGLAVRRIVVRFSAGARVLCHLQSVQTGCGALPASYVTSTCFFFPREKGGWSKKLTTLFHLVPSLRMFGVSSYTPSRAFLACPRTPDLALFISPFALLCHISYLHAKLTIYFVKWNFK